MTTSTTGAAFDYDVAIVGSGFGASVAALRLTEKGYRVVVLEAGARFADTDFAETTWDLKRFLWAPALGWFGIQRITWLRHVVVLAGAGVGGGSLNYANTLYRPPAEFFAATAAMAGVSSETDWEAELSPHYEQAQRMLGATSNPCDGPVERIVEKAAETLGVSDTVAVTPVGVFFDRPGVSVPDPYFGGVGPARTGCTECGQCMSGCRVGAKNTLLKNYLALAEHAGAEIRPLRTVVDLRREDAGYVVTHQRTGPAWRKRDLQRLRVGQVVLGAGAGGTQLLLQRCRASGSLPNLSPRLGELTRTNSEALVGAFSRRVELDGSRGVAITRSFHPDEHTHFENVRYGKGSNAMGLLSTLLVDGGDGPRWRAFGRQALRDPLRFLETLEKRRWSERTIIGLIMQSRDNSLTLTLKRGLLGARLISHPGIGDPNPNWIPAGHKAIRAVADAYARETGTPVQPGGTIGDIVDIPMTAHFLGGAPMGVDTDHGVIDAYHRVHGYPGLSVLDGSAVSANLGVNPSLTITAQAERAMSLWPNRTDPDPRPGPGQPYRRLPPVRPHRPVVPPGAPGELR